MMWHDSGWGWGAWIATGIVMLVVWSLVAWVAVKVARHGGGVQTSATPDADGALEILERRFANGDINEDEFRMRRDLLRTR